jgi:hypothetical protein
MMGQLGRKVIRGIRGMPDHRVRKVFRDLPVMMALKVPRESRVSREPIRQSRDRRAIREIREILGEYLTD